MSRKRHISTTISIDKVLARVEKQYGDFAGLLYDRMIPHAEDDATITGDAEELLAIVFPHRRDKELPDIVNALEGIASEGLIGWDKENEIIYFPIKSFYKYQSYIKQESRRTWDYDPGERKTSEISGDDCTSAENTGEQQETPENDGKHLSYSCSDSCSDSGPNGPTPKPPVGVSLVAGFEQFWDTYPVGHKEGKEKARTSYAVARKGTDKRKPASHETIMEGLVRSKKSAKWAKEGGQYIPMPATWLNQGRWEDDLPPAQAATGSRIDPSAPQKQSYVTVPYESRPQKIAREWALRDAAAAVANPVASA